MLSIFTIPKSFEANPHTALIQRNAITSWVRILGNRGEVLVCGDDRGVAAAAGELGARHLPGIPTTEFGTPYLSDAFERARSEARFELLCWANADIVFFPDLLEALAKISFRDFLAVGERWNLDVDAPINFSDDAWAQAFRKHALTCGVRNHVYGLDYFVFPRRTPLEMPRFVVGRVRWDHWMVHRALSERVPVVDLSRAVVAVHQNHGYEHVPQGTGENWFGPESDHNRSLYHGTYTLGDSTHEMEETGLIGRALSDRALHYRVLLARTRPRDNGSLFLVRVIGVVLRVALRRAPRARWWRWLVYFATHRGYGLR